MNGLVDSEELRLYNNRLFWIVGPVVVYAIQIWHPRGGFHFQTPDQKKQKPVIPGGLCLHKITIIHLNVSMGLSMGFGGILSSR